MPIKSLESYLFERKLVNTSSIEILQNATIGIDVDHYLGRIYTFKKEQFLAGIGGIPSSLKDYIYSDLKVFNELNIKPIFVISGLNTQLQTTKYRTNELSPQEQHLENTWSKLNNKHPYSNIESFRLFTDPLPLRLMINDLIRYFIEIGIDYLVAPYDASFQLSYLYNSGIIDVIYGSTDLLLTSIDKFILGMEFQSKDFRFIDKAKVLNELNLSKRQLLDLGIMVGCAIQPTTFSNFPPLPKPNPVQPYPQLSYFKLGLDIIYQYNSFNKAKDLYGYVASLNDQKSLELYFKGHSVIKYMPVLNKEGYVEFYSVEMSKLGYDENVDYLKEDDDRKTVKIPNDAHDIISQRLPPELYFYQSIGILPIKLSEAITHGYVDIRPSSESGLSDSYRKLITSSFYNDIWDYQYNLITQLLARYYQVKKISVKYWFRNDILELNNRLTPPIFKRIDKLFIQSDDSGDFRVSNFFNKLEGNSFVASKKITSNEDIISTVLLRTLYLYEIIDNKSKEMSSSCKIFKKFVDETDGLTDFDIQTLFLVLLLLKSQTFNITGLSNDYQSVPKYFKDVSGQELTKDELTHVTLLSRVFSLQKLNIYPINYQGPISRSLLHFRSHIKFILENFSTTMQCILIDFIVHQSNNDVKTQFKEKKDWFGLISQLPFYRDANNTLLGVVAEIYFEYSAKQAKLQDSKDAIIKSTQDHLMNTVYQINNSSFNINVHGMNSITADQLLHDFSEGVNFWKKFIGLCEIINETDKSLLNDNTYAQIVATDGWMKQFI